MDLLIEVGKQVPALGVLAWLVIHFLRQIKEIGAAHAEVMDRQAKRHQKAMAEIVDRYHEDSKRTQDMWDEILRRMGARSPPI